MGMEPAAMKILVDTIYQLYPITKKMVDETCERSRLFMESIDKSIRGWVTLQKTHLSVWSRECYR